MVFIPRRRYIYICPRVHLILLIFIRGFFYLWVTKLWFQKPRQILLLWNAENFYLVTIFGGTIFGGIIFGGTIFEITKEIPLKFKLWFLCVLSRPSVTKHCDLLFLVFLVPPDFFSRICKKSSIFSNFLGTPDSFQFFFKKSGIFSDFFGTPRFFFFSKKNLKFLHIFLGTPRFFFWFFFKNSAERH